MTTTPPVPETVPETGPDAAAEVASAPRRSRGASLALYLAIGTLIAAAVLGGFFIIVGDQANVAGRAWLTLLLVALFAGAVLLDGQVGDGPNRWYIPASTIVNVAILAVGLLKLWNGWLQPDDTANAGVWALQAGRLLLIVVLLRLALLFTQFYGLSFVTRARSAISKVMAIVTIGLVWVTVLVLAIPAAFPEYAWPDWWWRIAGATALVAVVTTVIPLLVRAFEPKAPKPPRPVQQVQYVPVQYAQALYAPPQYAQTPPAPPIVTEAQQSPVPPAAPVPPATPVPPAPADPAGGPVPPQ